MQQRMEFAIFLMKESFKQQRILTMCLEKQSMCHPIFCKEIACLKANKTQFTLRLGVQWQKQSGAIYQEKFTQLCWEIAATMVSLVKNTTQGIISQSRAKSYRMCQTIDPKENKLMASIGVLWPTLLMVKFAGRLKRTATVITLMEVVSTVQKISNTFQASNTTRRHT